MLIAISKPRREQVYVLPHNHAQTFSMVTKLSIGEMALPVIGIAHLAAPALSTAIFSNGLSAWTTIPSLLERGIDNSSISFWADKYSKLSGSTEVLSLLATIGLGIKGAVNLPFESFARFYYIVGTLSTGAYLLFTPYFRYKLKSISDYSTPVAKGSFDPKADIRQFLRVQALSSVFAGIGLASFWYSLYLAINNK